MVRERRKALTARGCIFIQVIGAKNQNSDFFEKSVIKNAAKQAWVCERKNLRSSFVKPTAFWAQEGRRERGAFDSGSLIRVRISGKAAEFYDYLLTGPEICLGNGGVEVEGENL